MQKISRLHSALRTLSTGLLIIMLLFYVLGATGFWLLGIMVPWLLTWTASLVLEKRYIRHRFDEHEGDKGSFKGKYYSAGYRLSPGTFVMTSKGIDFQSVGNIPFQEITLAHPPVFVFYYPLFKKFTKRTVALDIDDVPWIDLSFRSTQERDWFLGILKKHGVKIAPGFEER